MAAMPAGFAYYICAACQVTGLAPPAAPGRVRCWCCGELIPAWTRGLRPPAT